MEQRPLLILPEPAEAQPPGRTGRGPKVRPPSPGRQGERLQSRFDFIQRSFRELAPRVDGLEPEFVVVFEAADTIEAVARAATNIAGLEWLAEWDLDSAPPDDDFQIGDDPDARIPQRLFALMSNQSAIDRLVGLWNDWQRDPSARAKKGFGPFKNLFKTLRALRRWSARDRILDTGIADFWQEELQLRGQTVRFETELWFRHDAARRAAAAAEIGRILEQRGGSVIDECTIPSILYHAVLVECPREFIVDAIEQVRSLTAAGAEPVAELLLCDEVMFFQPRAQARVRPADGEEAAVEAVSSAEPAGDPIVAVLDGLPLERHQVLDGRLRIDDPDEFAHHYRPEQQRHGTAMASLIVNGDLDDDEGALVRPLHVQPVMRPQGRTVGGGEEFPDDRLFLDVLHRAIRRICVGEGNEAASSPMVRIINLSLGNPWRPFVREISPLAKLLDWLAWQHNLLFIVSAGNYLDPIELDCPPDEFAQQAGRDRLLTLFKGLRRARARRRLLSPAESMNALTVGATHADAGSDVDGNDVLHGHPYPSPLSRSGPGYGGSVKPEILLPGGRQPYRQSFGAGPRRSRFEIVDTLRPPGQRAAIPGAAGALGASGYSRGTSNATALATRLAAKVHDQVESLIVGATQFDTALLPAIVKALVVHAARWQDPLDVLPQLLDQGPWQVQRRQSAELFGFGTVDPSLALFATERRVVLLGGGHLGKDGAHVYRIPMPTEFDGQKLRRRLVTTLAWNSPPNFRERKYRVAKLFLSGSGQSEWFQGTTEADDKLAGQGTVVHLVRETEKRCVLPADPFFEVQVNCVEHASGLEAPVAYGLAVTLEVAEPIEVDLHESVRARLAVPVRAQP